MTLWWGGGEYWLSPSAAVAVLIPATFVEWEDEDTHCPSLLMPAVAWLPHLFVHDARQLGQHVAVVRPHLFLVLQLVLFDQTLVHVQSLTTGFCKLPAGGRTCNIYDFLFRQG